MTPEEQRRVAATQHLRNLIEDTRYGETTYVDLHKALDEVEWSQHMQLTKPEED